MRAFLSRAALVLTLLQASCLLRCVWIDRSIDAVKVPPPSSRTDEMT